MTEMNSLSFLLPFLPPKKRCVLLGIGNLLCRDDFAGMAVVQEIQKLGTIPGFLAVEGGSAPENVTGVICSFHPDVIIVVDAAFCSLPPGCFSLLSPEKITGATFSTHMLPLPVTLHYLETVCDCITFYIGLQPVSVAQGLGMSKEIKRGTQRLVKEFTALLKENTYDKDSIS